MNVVFHLNQSERLMHLIANVNNLAQFPDVLEIKIVINGDAVRCLRDCDWLKDITNPIVEVIACQNALEAHKVTVSDARIAITPAGVYKIMELQTQGFTYIKP